MKRVIGILVPLIALGGLIGWRLHVNMTAAGALAAQGTSGKNKTPLVAVEQVRARDIIKSFSATASIEAQETAKIAPKESGQIDFLQVHEGDHVVKDQVLVRLDPSQREADVRKQEAMLAEAQARLLQAQVTQNPVNVGVTTQIVQGQLTVKSAQSECNQVSQTYAATIAAADADVTDNEGKVASAKAAVANAQAALGNAKANSDNASSKLTRITSLYKQNFIAAQDVDDARTAVSVAEGSVNVATAQVNAAKSAEDSARAQLNASKQQASIARSKGHADIMAARSKVLQAKASLTNVRSNAAQKPAYQANLAALRATVASTQADLINAKVLLDQTILRAPMDGNVTARSMDQGSMASPGQPILTIQAIKKVWANVAVPEDEIGHIYSGQDASITIDAIPDTAFAGKVIQVNPSADPASRDFTVRISLDNSRGLIKPGMFARVALTTERIPNAVVVPLEALQTGPDGAFAWVVTDANTLERHPVTTGASDSSGIAILSGVSPGMKVVTLTAAQLHDGQTVKLGPAGDPGAAGHKGGGHGHKKHGGAA